MDDPIGFDPALLAAPAGWCWATGGGVSSVMGPMLETKAQAGPAEALMALMAEMSLELRAQFAAFKTLRIAAETVLGDSSDEGELKLAKADIKAANDALGQIVRTLEKIDGLQRGLMRDVEEASERQSDTRSLEEIIASINRKLDRRLAERLEVAIAERADAVGSDPAGAGFAGAGDTGPP